MFVSKIRLQKTHLISNYLHYSRPKSIFEDEGGGQKSAKKCHVLVEWHFI